MSDTDNIDIMIEQAGVQAWLEEKTGEAPANKKRRDRKRFETMALNTDDEIIRHPNGSVDIVSTRKVWSPEPFIETGKHKETTVEELPDGTYLVKVVTHYVTDAQCRDRYPLKKRTNGGGERATKYLVRAYNSKPSKTVRPALLDMMEGKSSRRYHRKRDEWWQEADEALSGGYGDE